MFQKQTGDCSVLCLQVHNNPIFSPSPCGKPPELTITPVVSMWDVVSWLSGAARGHHVLRYPKILLQESNLSGWEVTRCNSVLVFPCRQWEIYSRRKPSIACETSISRNQWYYEEEAKGRSNNFWQRLTFDIKCKIDFFSGMNEFMYILCFSVSYTCT